MSRPYLSLHSSQVEAVWRLLWMISALSLITLSPSLWTLKFKRKRLICCQKIGYNESYSNIWKTQFYLITEFLRAQYPLIELFIWNQRKRSQKAECFTALSPLNSFISSESCLKASLEVFSNSFSLLVDAWVKTKRLLVLKN